jgi:hypothetical protein
MSAVTMVVRPAYFSVLPSYVWFAATGGRATQYPGSPAWLLQTMNLQRLTEPYVNVACSWGATSHATRCMVSHFRTTIIMSGISDCGVGKQSGRNEHTMV